MWRHHGAFEWFQQMHQKLAMGEDKALPQSYKHIKTTLMFGKEKLQYETAGQNIISHVNMNKKGESSKERGLHAKGSKEGSNKKQGQEVR